MKDRKRPDLVSVFLSPKAKALLDDACARRAMSIRMLLGRLTDWFLELDQTEQSIVLGQVEDADVSGLVKLLAARRSKRAAARRSRKSTRRGGAGSA